MSVSSSTNQPKNRAHRVMPFFGLSLGVSVFALSLLVVLPFAMMILTTLEMGFADIIRTIREPQVFAAIKLSLSMAALATLTNVIFGTLIAWVLVRYDFWGKSIINALVDLPFALPTAVTGIALATLYAPNGLFGQWFSQLGIALTGEPIKIAFTPIGIWLALVVVSFPFIVRAVQPVLAELSVEFEEAAAVMGASRLTTFRRVVLPEITPAILIGSGMMFARATGEYGSVIFIAGNIPMQSEILPLIIVSKLEQFDVAGAACVALFMLLLSLIVLFGINFAQWKLSARLGAKTN
ncbi:sulfate ABC transporter permease subunit CysT [Moraxella sp. FZLJ2107]|uniref:sulfate ABC transporter permease subunit CysT n=1 Tax=unclassified Moraxella TaxID=2685852 RepID=UPI0020C8CA5B|nr:MULTISPECIES: sulfate ABC transporter permease subunit CysT [unclassified Moraxella]UTO05264.1 sulfate ABC transporter permease subunit CysT [Moraxella sp. FZLJ2107]UTO21999.1 sulfate ABC transporter permease subunit CysT [Moraxella sp. FZLJ2109]